MLVSIVWSNLGTNYIPDYTQPLPDQRKSLFLRQVIHSDLFKEAALNFSSRLEHIYLKADFYFLVEGSLREYCLHLRHNGTVNNASSGPIAWTSWRILDTIVKYCGKSVVRIRVILLVFRSSIWLIST